MNNIDTLPMIFLVGHRENTVEMRSTFKDGKLISSFSKVTQNCEGETYASTIWDGSKYQVHTDKGTHIVTEQATYSVVSFNFKEPQVRNNFAERLGNFFSLQSPSPGVYPYWLPNVDLNIYINQDGRLRDVTVKISHGNASIKFID